MMWVSANGMDPPGLKVTMFTCMSCAMSLASEKRVVAHTSSVSGIETGSMSLSLVTNEAGASTPSRYS